MFSQMLAVRNVHFFQKAMSNSNNFFHRAHNTGSDLHACMHVVIMNSSNVWSR